jgi:hypothetical protein
MQLVYIDLSKHKATKPRDRRLCELLALLDANTNRTNHATVEEVSPTPKRVWLKLDSRQRPKRWRDLDPLRIWYPNYPYGSDIPARDVSGIVEKEELNGGVYNVRVLGEKAVYVCETLERSFYVPPDSEVLEQKLLTLGSLRGNKVGIVQLIAAVISSNPYQTSQSGTRGSSVVLRGILLEYHPNGIGGFTRQWFAPEMQDGGDPPSRSMEARTQNDIWALGKMISAMADVCCDGDEQRLLESVARSATRPPPRLPLGDAITALPGDRPLASA